MGKSKSTYRGGRGHSRIRYYIDVSGHHLVEWPDGSREWIPEALFDATLNRFLPRRYLRGHNHFITRRSVERWISQIDAEVVLEKTFRSGPGPRKRRCWVYPKATTKLETTQSVSLTPGTIVGFNSNVTVWRERTAVPFHTRPVGPSDCAVVIDSSHGGAITQVLLSDFTGWVETRHLFSIKEREESAENS